MTDRQRAPDLDPLEFLETQLCYWDAVLRMARNGLAEDGVAATHSAPTAWPDALEVWWDAVATARSLTDGRNLDQPIPLGQAYLLFGSQAVRIIECLDEAVQRGEDWRSGIQKGVDRIRACYYAPFEGREKLHPRLAALWGLPLGSWQQVATGGPMSLCGVGISSPPSISALAAPRADSDWQLRARQGAALWQDYQNAHRVYAELVHCAADSSLDLLELRLIERGESQQPITTLRELYNLWVDCADESYAELIRGQEYSQVQGRMINTLMRARQHEQSMFSDILTALRTASRSKLDEIHACLVETRGQITQLAAAIADNSHSDQLRGILLRLQADLDVLRRELDTIKPKIIPAASARKSARERHVPSSASREKTNQ